MESLLFSDPVMKYSYVTYRRIIVRKITRLESSNILCV